MFRQSRFIFLTVTLLLVLFVSMARPMAVYADDSTPPPPATEEPANPPTEEAPVETESGSTSEAPASEAPTSEAPAEVPSEPVATETPTEPSTEAEPVVVSEILEAAPEGTEVVVLDENSETVPLASQEAAEIVAVTDPMWCPAGVQPGGAGCTTNFASPQALIDDMDASNPNTPGLGVYEQDGIIYFTANPGGEFVLTRGNGNALQNLDYDAVKIYNLTLQGGWNGVTGAGFALSGQTNFGANRVQIGTSANPWAGNITINNFSMDGVVNNSGLVVYAAGAINLNSVDSQNNTGTSGTTGYGAYLVNTSGNNDVTIQNSSFDNNTQSGLRVTSNGDITLSGIMAVSNNKRGAHLDNTTGSGNITVSSSNYVGNTGVGLEAHSNGNITLLSVLAGDNLDTGALLDNTTGTGNMNVSASAFNGNGVDGLEGYSNGEITIANITVNGNAEIGASLVNDTGESNVTVSNSTFNSNTSTGQDVGLEISSGGDVTLSDVSVSNNLAGTGSFISAGGLVIENSIFSNNASSDAAFGQGLVVEADEAEIICSQFTGNSTYGLDGTLVGLLTLDDVVFGGNGSGSYLGSPFVTTGGCSPDEGAEGGEGGEEGEGEGENEGEGEEAGGAEGEEESSSSDSAEIIPLTGLLLNVVSVSGSEKVELDCEAFSGTKLVLPNGDSLILPCPIRDEGTLTGQTQDALPGQLDDQFDFLSAMNTGVIRDGQALSLVDTGMTVEFVIPDGQTAENLAILHWDGSKWAEFPGQVTADGYFAVTTNFTGVFVLVTK